MKDRDNNEARNVGYQRDNENIREIRDNRNDNEINNFDRDNDNQTRLDVAKSRGKHMGRPSQPRIVVARFESLITPITIMSVNTSITVKPNTIDLYRNKPG